MTESLKFRLPESYYGVLPHCELASDLSRMGTENTRLPIDPSVKAGLLCADEFSMGSVAWMVARIPMKHEKEDPSP